MSREDYQVPTGAGSNSPFAQGGNAAFASRTGGGAVAEKDETAIRYLCSDCGCQNKLLKSQPVMCLDCGCRVLYKERTKRMIQFEAR